LTRHVILLFQVGPSKPIGIESDPHRMGIFWKIHFINPPEALEIG
jgi:hypothetical protein